MPANEVVDIATTRTGDDNAKKPIVDETIYRPNKFLRGLQGFNASMKFGGGKVIGDQKIRSLNERPFLMEVEVTAAAAAGATSVSINDTSFIRKYERVGAKNQDIRVTADPVSLTSFSCDALAADIAAGTILLLHGPTVPEGWPRPKAISRAVEDHDDFTSTKQRAFAYTKHLEHREFYGEVEVNRIRKQAMEEFDRVMGLELMLAEGRDGTSSGEFSTNGLIRQGYQYNYIFVNGGVLTTEMINEAGYMLMAEGNAAGDLDLITGPRLISAFSYVDQREGIIRNNDPTKPTFGAGMVGRIASAIDHVSGYVPYVDHTLRSKQWDRIVMLVNWDCIDAIQNGVNVIENEQNASRPNGVADPGTGIFQGQMTRSCGFKYKIPTGAVVLFDNVGTIRR